MLFFLFAFLANVAVALADDIFTASLSNTTTVYPDIEVTSSLPETN